MGLPFSTEIPPNNLKLKAIGRTVTYCYDEAAFAARICLAIATIWTLVHTLSQPQLDKRTPVGSISVSTSVISNVIRFIRFKRFKQDRALHRWRQSLCNRQD